MSPSNTSFTAPMNEHRSPGRLVLESAEPHRTFQRPGVQYYRAITERTRHFQDSVRNEVTGRRSDPSLWKCRFSRTASGAACNRQGPKKKRHTPQSANKDVTRTTTEKIETPYVAFPSEPVAKNLEVAYLRHASPGSANEDVDWLQVRKEASPTRLGLLRCGTSTTSGASR